ncbi:hypothetical protein RO07_02460 [Pandoraea pulmonicola]|uniref:Uncharacterized protein n=1 Tax=Pandoraea pulmonicola TaxID=93221 RepID=A0ABM5RVY1_PANPU|nr:hypothetical protein RO07_02460 [Pandoraea pulmonicola]
MIRAFTQTGDYDVDRDATRQAIWREITEDDPAVRAAFIRHFRPELERFSVAMSIAHQTLHEHTTAIGDNGDMHIKLPADFMRACLFMHTQSTRLLTSGHLAPAGNTFRQVLEALSMAMLCSDRQLQVARDYSKYQDYSTNSAVGKLFEKCSRWGMNRDTVGIMREAEKLYHRFSHIGRASDAAMYRLSDSTVFAGANFDDHDLKLELYDRMYQVLLNFTGICQTVFDVIRKNAGIDSPRYSR